MMHFSPKTSQDNSSPLGGTRGSKRINKKNRPSKIVTSQYVSCPPVHTDRQLTEPLRLDLYLPLPTRRLVAGPSSLPNYRLLWNPFRLSQP